MVFVALIICVLTVDRCKNGFLKKKILFLMAISLSKSLMFGLREDF